MRRLTPLPCLFSDGDIYIRSGAIPGRYYFEKDNELKGYFKQSGNYWIWYYQNHTRRFRTISELFEDVSMVLD